MVKASATCFIVDFALEVHDYYRTQTIVTSYHKKVSIHRWRASGKTIMTRVIDSGWRQTGRRVFFSYSVWVRPAVSKELGDGLRDSAPPMGAPSALAF